MDQRFASHLIQIASGPRTNYLLGRSSRNLSQQHFFKKALLRIFPTMSTSKPEQFLLTASLLLIALLNVTAMGQQQFLAPNLSASEIRVQINFEPPQLTPSAILAGFIAAETRTRQALNQHTFKREVVLQTIGPNGEVTGEYVRNSQFLFDDQGKRIERVLFHPPSTIREMRITKEDIQDLAGAQLLGIDIVESGKYHLTYVGPELLEGRETWAIDVEPITQPNPHRMRERFFIGRVWISELNFQIVKVSGVVEPQGKQRFPHFETWREPGDSSVAYFPARTTADQVLHFTNSSVHYRIKVRYYEYKQFASKVTVTDLEELSSN
jgi:hypothetical protein